ncbi:MAG: hypothetical protein V3T72_19025, partial [Thermoanaerobaculia bacterium]
RRFDLGEILMFVGKYREARQVFSDAVGIIPGDRRGDTIKSVLGPLENYLASGVLETDLAAEVTRVMKVLQAAI